MKKKRILLFLAAGLFVAGQASAEVSSDTATTVSHTGKEVVVTAGRLEESKKEVTTNVTIITRKQIEDSPAQDLGELLAEQSIGHIQKYPGALTSVGIRGFRSDTHGNDLRGKILILIDGRRAGTGNLAKLMTDNIERIEIIRGPGAVQYGSAAIGGVINVITRKGEGKPSFFAEQELGTFGYTKTIAGAIGAVGKFDYSATVSIADRGDYKTGDGKRYRNSGYDDDIRGSVNLGYELSPGNRIGVTYTHFEIDRAGTPDQLVNNDLDDYKKTSNRSIDFRYTGKSADERFSWMARYFVGEDKDASYDPIDSNPTFWDDGVPFKKNTDQQGAQGQLSYTGKQVTITAGIDWLNYDLDQSDYTPRESSYDDIGYFALAKGLLFDERLVLTAGLRFDGYDVKYKRDAATPETSQDSDSFVKSFGMAYHVSDNVKLRASYGEGFQIPEAEELAADYWVTNWMGTKHYIGNPDLKPEKSRTIDGGIEVNIDGFASSFTVFTTDYKDFIQRVEIAPDVISWVNQDHATVTGFEGDISYVFPVKVVGSTLFFEPYASGTYLTDYTAHFDDGSPDEVIKYIPEWNLSTGVRLRNARGFSGVFNLAYFGKTEVQDWSTWPATDVTKGAFCVANMSLAKKFTLGNSTTAVTVKGSVENLFDRDYEYVLGYPMPGRFYTFGLRVDI